MDSPKIEISLICQAGSAEAFAGSPATGREYFDNRHGSDRNQVLICFFFIKVRFVLAYAQTQEALQALPNLRKHH